MSPYPTSSFSPIHLATAGAVLLPSLAHAAGEVPTSAAGSILQMIFGLIVVVAALFFTLVVLKRLQGGRSQISAGLKIVGATHVGPRERVVLLRVANKVLVLGVTAGQIEALHTLEAADLPEEPAAPSAPAADFAGRLRQFMERRNAK